MKPVKLRLILAAAALALGACGNKNLKTLEHPDQVAPKVYYVNPAPFRALRFAPPPEPGSMEQQADIAGVLAWQNKRTEADCAKSSRTAEETYDSFWGARSPFPAPVPPGVHEFFVRLAADLEASLETMKERYQRPRPYMAYSEAQPCIKRSKSFSYPSGHTTFARVFANVLADLLPARRDEFFSKADEIAQDRVIGGVHYPGDVAAGKVFGDLYHAELLKSAAYQKDLEKLRALLAR